MTTRVGAVNAKGGITFNGIGAKAHDGTKLDHAGDRITRAIKSWNREGTTVAFSCEFSLVQAQRIEQRHRRWAMHRTVNNSRQRGNRRAEVGNVIMWRRDVWKCLERDVLVVNVSGIAKGHQKVLHLPVVVLQHRETGEVVTFYGVHAPAGKRPVILRDKLRCQSAVNADSRKRKGKRVVFGDFNSVTLFRGWRGYKVGVDHVRSKRVKLRKPVIHWHMHKTVTDHRAGISAELVLS